MRKLEKEFTASVTHELRTPLTVIKSAADNMGSGIVPADKIPVYTRLITEQSDRLEGMIEEILLYSRLEGKNSRKTRLSNVNTSELVYGLRSTLDTIVASSAVNLVWDTDGLPGYCRIDAEVLLLAVENLVTNAVNHAYGPGGGDVRIRFKYLLDGRLKVTVEDDGRGIHSREQKKVFTAFYRDEVSRERQEKEAVWAFS